MLLLLCVVLVEFSFGIKGYYDVANVAYYEQPPYIYKNENGSMTGIFPEIFEDLTKMCFVDFKYSLNTISARNFSNLFKNKTAMDKYMHGNWIWLPLTQDVSGDQISSLKFIQRKILTTGTDVLVHRHQVGPFAKIKIGIFECRYLFLISLMLSAIFGTSIWFIERCNNSAFSKNSNGILTGLWFGLVTMTTVGYGDIAPKSAMGKLLTVAWMVTGVILTAILTSTITNVFGELDYQAMGDKKILAMEKSLEVSSSLYEYKSAKVKSVRDYELVFDGLIKKDYSVGVVDTFVRRYHQSKLDDLRVVKVISDVPIVWLYRYTGFNHLVIKLVYCMDHMKFSQHSYAIQKYNYILEEEKKLNIEIDMIEFFTEPAMFTVTILAGALVACGFLVEAILMFRKYLKKASGPEKITKQATRTDTEFDDVNNKSSSLYLQHPATKGDLNVLDGKINALREEMSSIKATLQVMSDKMN